MKRRVLLSVLAVALVLSVSTQFAQAFGNRMFAKFNPCAPAVTACEPCAPVAVCEPCAPVCYDACCKPACRPFAAFRAKFRCHMDSFRSRFCNPCAAPCAVTACEPVIVAPCEPVVVAPCVPVAPACEPVCVDTCDTYCPPAPCRPFAKLRARLASFRSCNPCCAVVTACEPACCY